LLAKAQRGAAPPPSRKPQIQPTNVVRPLTSAGRSRRSPGPKDPTCTIDSLIKVHACLQPIVMPYANHDKQRRPAIRARSVPTPINSPIVTCRAHIDRRQLCLASLALVAVQLCTRDIHLIAHEIWCGLRTSQLSVQVLWWGSAREKQRPVSCAHDASRARGWALRGGAGGHQRATGQDRLGQHAGGHGSSLDADRWGMTALRSSAPGLPARICAPHPKSPSRENMLSRMSRVLTLLMQVPADSPTLALSCSAKILCSQNAICRCGFLSNLWQSPLSCARSLTAVAGAII